MDHQSQFVFVYGSLRRAGTRHDLIKQQSQYVSDARVSGRLFLVTSYPGLVTPQSDNDWVLGEVYKMNDPSKLLHLLDEYEECTLAYPQPHEYIRELKEVELITHAPSNRFIRAWLYRYCWPVEPSKLIPSGDFMQELAK